MSVVWLLLAALALGVVYWPTSRRRYCSHASAAHRALAAKAWEELDRCVIAARKAAEEMSAGVVREYALGDLDLLEAQGAYWCGELDRASGRLGSAVEHIERAGAPDRALKVSMARHFMGDVHFDAGNLDRAEEEYRAAVQSVAFTPEPEMAIFSLQRLSDVLLEKRDRSRALDVIEQCVEYELRILAKTNANTGSMISMIQPDLAMASGDYVTAERLFREKVEYWSQSGNRSESIDLTRYQFHLAAALQEMGRYEASAEILRHACQLAKRDLGPQHPRTVRAFRKLSEAERLMAVAR